MSTSEMGLTLCDSVKLKTLHAHLVDSEFTALFSQGRRFHAKGGHQLTWYTLVCQGADIPPSTPYITSTQFLKYGIS